MRPRREAAPLLDGAPLPFEVKRRRRRPPASPAPEVLGRVAELRAEQRAIVRRTRCPGCGCTAIGPRCSFYLGADLQLGVGQCVPRGTLGLKRCSACDPDAPVVRVPMLGVP